MTFHSAHNQLCQHPICLKYGKPASPIKGGTFQLIVCGFFGGLGVEDLGGVLLGFLLLFFGGLGYFGGFCNKNK